MSNKKALYRPAPEHPIPTLSSTLPQGETASIKRNLPRIKQGILETSQRGNKPLTSTLKISKPSTKPIVVCHNPKVVHTYIKECDSSTEQAKDTVATPKVVVIPPTLNQSCNTSSQQKHNASNSAPPIFVKSRYKQAASNVASSKNKSANDSTKSRERSRKDRSANHSIRSPLVKNHVGKTSTPSSVNRQKLDFDWNASAIDRSSSVSTSFSPAKPSLSSDTMNEEEDCADDLEILYCRHIQSRSLYLTVKKEADAKSKQAPKELLFLQQKNAEHAEEQEKLEKEVLQLEHQNELQKQLEQQKTALGPIVDKINSISVAYSTLAENLDTTRHNIPLVDAFVPNQDDLESTLDETRNLLGQINIMIHSQAPVIDQMSCNASDLSKGCKDNTKAISTAHGEIEKEISSAMKKASLAAQLEFIQS